jgi:hypothetical protein
MELSIQTQDPHLTKALELWATEHMLVDHKLKWPYKRGSRLCVANVNSRCHHLPIAQHATERRVVEESLSLQIDATAVVEARCFKNGDSTTS